jgi:hypothetical protein
MARDHDVPGVGDEFTDVGRTPVRAKMFARVDGILLVADAARPARASLTAFYEGTLTLLGTPGATAVTAALAQTGSAVTGIVTLRLAEPGATGVYVVEGQARGRRFVLRGGNGLGAELRWRGELGGDGAVHGPFRLVMPDARLAGMLTLAPTSAPGSCGSEVFAGTVVAEVAVPVCSRPYVPGELHAG